MESVGLSTDTLPSLASPNQQIRFASAAIVALPFKTVMP
jgi:hypothetical protein